MTSLNTLAADKGVPSRGEELERNAMNTAPAKRTLPQVTCPWQGYDACRTCELFGKCITLEAQHGAA